MVAHLRGIESETLAPSDCIREYRNLGTPQGDTLLAELFPLPKPGTGVWPAAYRDEFGFHRQDAYYDATWPRDTIPGVDHCPRASVLASALAAIPLAPDRMVFAYGRGGRHAEFWHRFDRLLSPHTVWEDVIRDVAQIARHHTGAIVARLAHPSGSSRNPIRIGHIPQLVVAIQRLRDRA